VALVVSPVARRDESTVPRAESTVPRAESTVPRAESVRAGVGLGTTV